MKIHLGQDRKTNKPVYLPTRAFQQHLHLVGYTGTGKTTALVTLLLGLLPLSSERKCVFIIDRLGGFSTDLLRWFSSRYCPTWVRERLIYIEAAREDRVVPMNPLLHATPGEGYYRTARAAEIVLRGWANQDLSTTPRLARWLFNAFYAVAVTGLTIVDSAHLLFPFSEVHRVLLNSLPEVLRLEWQQIIKASGGQAEIQLESARNRLKPFFDCPGLLAMFSSSANHFDVARWMQDQRIVIVNLAADGQASRTGSGHSGRPDRQRNIQRGQVSGAEQRRDTLVILDEFQRFVGPDLEFSLAESRQLKTSLVLSHQSFSQLQQGEVDLTSLIFQAQTRLALKVAGDDAAILAEELAGLTFDPKKVKDEIWHKSQRISGHKIIDLQSTSTSEQLAKQWSESFGTREGRTENRVQGVKTNETFGDAKQAGRTDGGSSGQTKSTGSHQSVLPIYEEYVQLASRTYTTFEEQRCLWAQMLRKLKRGQGILQIVDDAQLYHVDIHKAAQGILTVPWERVQKRLPQVAEAHAEMLERNCMQECFQSPVLIERESQRRIQNILMPPIVLHSSPVSLETPGPVSGQPEVDLL